MQSKQTMTVTELLKSWRIPLLLAFFGLVLICWGFATLLFSFYGAIYGYLEWGEVFMGIMLMVAGGLLFVPFFARRARNERIKFENQIMQEILKEEEELQRIRKTMTPAEWEIYKVQKENQKLLKQIKDKPTGASGPRGVYGIVNDISD